MSKEIDITSTRSASAAEVKSGNGSSSTGGVSKHSMLDGIVSTADEYSQFSREIHLTAEAANALGRLSEFEVIKSTDEEAVATDSNLYSALKAKQEDEKIKQEMEAKYIRKDIPDATDFRVDFKDGLTAGSYVGGTLGDGAIIDKDGHAEMSSLKLREFLEVPELRFNRIDVVSGELWNAIAFGLIESVDTANRLVTLKLEEGELSGLHVNDFCRGIFHNLTGNATEAGKDASGFDVMTGFSTSYFTPVQLIDRATFKYELKPGTTVHPCKAMKFAVYGNPTEKNRQSSAYHTRTYTRYLRNVDTWKIEDRHISIQLGDLSNLSIGGVPMGDGSIYLSNVYFGGNVWYTPQQKEEMKGNDAYSVTLSTYNAIFHVEAGVYGTVSVATGQNGVTTAANQVIAKEFNTTTRIQATRGAEALQYSDTLGAGKYIVTSEGKGCKYTISGGLVAVTEVTEERAEIKLSVNCEGIATYELVFMIVRVADGMRGIDGKDIEFIYLRTATETAPSTPATSQTDDFVPSGGWTDDPVGPIGSLPYEWMCKRAKIEGVWGAFSAPALWSKYSFDGTDGVDGKETEFIYMRTLYNSRPSPPATSQTDDFVPSGGWTDDPLGVTASYQYEWVSKRTKENAIWSDFSTPALWSKFGNDGADGADGKDGQYVEQRYKRSKDQPEMQMTVVSPPGWSLTPPQGELPLWMSKATFNADGTIPNEGYWTWSYPVKISGDAGAPGTAGEQGPFVISRGKYSSEKQYVGNPKQVEVVYVMIGETPTDKGTARFYQTKTTAGAFIDKQPDEDTQYWKAYQGQFESIATGFAFIEEANIAGWMFQNNYIESQNHNVVLDGTKSFREKPDGTKEEAPRIALGTSHADRYNAPTRLYEDGRIVTQKLEAENGCKIGNFTIKNGWIDFDTINDQGGYVRLYNSMSSDGSHSEIALGSNLVPSIVGGVARATASIYNGIGNKAQRLPNGAITEYHRNIALMLESQYSDMDIALQSRGGRIHMGRIWEMEPVKLIKGGGGYTLEEFGSMFAFEITSDLSFTLPDPDAIFSILYNFNDNVSSITGGTYTIRLFVTKNSTARVLVQGVSKAPLLNQNGDINNMGISGVSYGGLWMARGDFAILTYYNKNWYTQNSSY